MQVKNNLNELEKIYDELEDFCSELTLSSKIRNNLFLCIEEVFSNIVKYAYDDSNEHCIEILLNFDRLANKLTITIMDDGRPFNPLKAAQPNLSLDLLEREIGGLGIFIVSNIMSSLEYSRLNSKNKLEMTKNIE